MLSFTRGWGRNILFLSNRRDRELNPELWRELGSGANHYPRAPARLYTHNIGIQMSRKELAKPSMMISNKKYKNNSALKG